LFQELEPLTTEISMLFAAFYFRAWARARRVFNVLCEYLPGATALTRTSPWEAWTHRALLFNLNTHIHRDLNDDVHGFAAITVFGSFTGGNFVIPELRIKFPFQPGDVIFLKGQMLAHFVTPWEKKGEDGERFSIVHFNHQKVADWVNRKNPEGQEGLDTPEIGVWSEEV
jgi:hypothetical protein